MLGFSLTWTGTNPYIGNIDLDLSTTVDDDYINGHWFKQYLYAATTVSIISGALSERCTIVGYLIYTFILSGK